MATFIGVAVAMASGFVTSTCGRHYSAADVSGSPDASDDAGGAVSASSPDAASSDSGVTDASDDGDASDGSTGAMCPDLAGTWDFTGGCGDATCVFTQNGCSVGVTCGSDRALAGTVATTSLSFAGTIIGMASSCVGGPFAEDAGKGSFPGTCVIGGNSCAFEATQSN